MFGMGRLSLLMCQRPTSVGVRSSNDGSPFPSFSGVVGLRLPPLWSQYKYIIISTAYFKIDRSRSFGSSSLGILVGPCSST